MKNPVFTRIAIAGLLITAMVVSLSAHAKRAPSAVDYADVLDVQPIIETYQHRVPTESCWTEKVRNQRPLRRHQNDSLVGTVVGGVIGGAIGHAVGHKKRNKQVGTAVGALLGATIGHDATRSRSSSHIESYYTHERRCETVYDTEYRDETVGYWVTYDYQGRQHRTRMNRDPGDRIRVRVTIEPL
jgi:uncharacterized protein YcfJ